MQALILDPAHRTASVHFDFPLPTPGPKELLVQVHAVALNPVDAQYVANPLAPEGSDRVVGSDFAGEVVQLGESLSGDSTLGDDGRVHVGARVAGFLQGACSVNARPGAFAQYVAVPYDLVWLIPPSQTYTSAASVSLCATTAAQAVFFRLGMPCPWWPTAGWPVVSGDSDGSNEMPVTVFVYGASTSLAMYAAQLVRLAERTAGGRTVRLVGAASAARHAALREAPYAYDALVDYRAPDWPAQVRRLAAAGKGDEEGDGVDYAIDTISEGPTVALVESTLKRGLGDGRYAAIRGPKGGLYDWDSLPSKPTYGAVWEALGVEIQYYAFTVPESPKARDFAAKFYAFLSSGAAADQALIEPNPTRLMPGGLERIVPDGLALLGAGFLSERKEGERRTEEYMRPISGEKVVYEID